MPAKPEHLFNIPRDEWPACILESVTALFDQFFPDRLQAVFLFGSRSENSAASISDIDAMIVFKAKFIDENEKEHADSLLKHCRLLSPLRLDIGVIAEQDLRGLNPADIRFSQGGTLIHGIDNRTQWLPEPSLEQYQSFIWPWAANFVGHLHKSDNADATPVAPDPEERFLGYTQIVPPAWHPPGVTNSTKLLVASLCWCATAMLAAKGIRVTSRHACLQAVPAELPASDAELVSTVYQKCKLDWDYQIPAAASDQQELTSLCHRSLAFFTSWSQQYRQHRHHR